MSDLNMLMREQARNGLLVQLDKATIDGDAEAARKITADLEKLAISTAPKAPPYGDVEIRAQLDKLDWFGVDPKKSGRVIALGRDMDPKKFATAEAFATALIKAVDEEFKPTGTAADETDEERETREAAEAEPIATGKTTPAPKRKTDGPGEAEASVRGTPRQSGPWAKVSDAPADVQKEIKRQTDKFVSAHATKEQRESYVAKVLESHYAQFQRAKGKK